MTRGKAGTSAEPITSDPSLWLLENLQLKGDTSLICGLRVKPSLKSCQRVLNRSLL